MSSDLQPYDIVRVDMKPPFNALVLKRNTENGLITLLRLDEQPKVAVVTPPPCRRIGRWKVEDEPWLNGSANDKACPDCDEPEW